MAIFMLFLYIKEETEAQNCIFKFIEMMQLLLMMFIFSLLTVLRFYVFMNL